jgi:hypothetical protein
MVFTVTHDDPVEALLFWTLTAITSAERVLSPGDFSPWSRQNSPSERVKAGDAALLLLALRNVLRAADATARTLSTPTDSGETPDEWIAQFKAMLPGLVNARDVLEHFDDYAAGRGRLQKSGPEPYQFTYSVQDGEPIVSVGRFSLQVRTARTACRSLFVKLVAEHGSQNPLSEAAERKAEALLDEILPEGLPPSAE